MSAAADRLTQRALTFARTHEEKLRFLLVGVCNTAIGYALFAVMLLLLGTERYSLALVLGWMISVSISYTNFKLFVFKTRGTNWVAEWLRSYIVYAGGLVVNLLILNAFVKLAHMHPLVGQAASIFFVTIISYLGHKYFTFGGRPVIEAVDDSAAFEADAASAPGEEGVRAPGGEDVRAPREPPPER